MHPEHFEGSPSGQVVWAGPREARYCAFVPHALPPVIVPDGELLNRASDAAYALGELAALGRHMQNPHLLISPFVRREAVLSSRIEGTRASITDLYAFEAGQLPLPLLGVDTSASESEVREVANYVGALEYGLQRLDTLPMSLRLLRELHARLLQGVRGEHATPGEFRTSQNWIGKPGCTLLEADYVPPPPTETNDALGAFEKYLHSDDPAHTALVRLALLHYQFEAIHPFLDGNGRIGRLLVSLILVHWGLLPSPLLYLSAYLERHRDQYYHLLLEVSQRGAWRDWVSFFLLGITEQAQDAARRAKRLEDLRDNWRDQLTQTRASALPPALVDFLFGLPLVTIPQAEAVLGVTYRAAQNIVGKLVSLGILEQLGQATYGKTYVAWDIIRIVSENGA